MHDELQHSVRPSPVCSVGSTAFSCPAQCPPMAFRPFVSQTGLSNCGTRRAHSQARETPRQDGFLERDVKPTWIGLEQRSSDSTPIHSLLIESCICTCMPSAQGIGLLQQLSRLEGASGKCKQHKQAEVQQSWLIL